MAYFKNFTILQQQAREISKAPSTSNIPMPKGLTKLIGPARLGVK